MSLRTACQPFRSSPQFIRARPSLITRRCSSPLWCLRVLSQENAGHRPRYRPDSSHQLDRCPRRFAADSQAERASVATNGHCGSLDDLLSSGALTMTRPERDGYTYQVSCSGAEFSVIAEHPPAPAGSPIRYPTLSIASNMEIKSN